MLRPIHGLSLLWGKGCRFRQHRHEGSARSLWGQELEVLMLTEQDSVGSGSAQFCDHAYGEVARSHSAG